MCIYTHHWKEDIKYLPDVYIKVQHWLTAARERRSSSSASFSARPIAMSSAHDITPGAPGTPDH